jgi:hypothetical protein
LLALLVTSLLTADAVSLPEKVFSAATIAEFTVRLEPARPPSMSGRVVFPPEVVDAPPKLQRLLTADSPCLSAARRKKQLKLIAFFDAEGKQLAGVEQDKGHATDLDPDYLPVLEAVFEAKQWTDERMRAVAPESLWREPKKALLSENPSLRRLAATFLTAHDAAHVIDAAWGAPGTPDRKAHEARAVLPSGLVCSLKKPPAEKSLP